MKKDVIYLIDKEIQLYHYKTNKIYTCKLPSSILFLGKINNIKKFTEYFQKFLKEENLQNFIFYTKVQIIINDYYLESDKIILRDIISKIYSPKIEFIKEKQLLDLNKKNIYINYSVEYTLIHLINSKVRCILIENKLFKEKEFIIYIKKISKNKTMYIYGNNDLSKLLDKKSYIYQDKNKYILSKFIT